MTATVDISDVDKRLAAPHDTESAHRTIAVVVPLAEGRSEVVQEFLAEGPPFDPSGIGLDSHKVFLTDREVVFVFETEEGVNAFERILAEPEFWDVLSAWQRNMSGEPRVGAAVYEFPERQHRPEAPQP